MSVAAVDSAEVAAVVVPVLVDSAGGVAPDPRNAYGSILNTQTCTLASGGLTVSTTQSNHSNS